jgi:DNA-binding PadR family transcriptional regulator
MPSEIVLLFWVKTGMGTPYAMFNLAGLAIGGSSPALKRLERAGLLTSEEGPRNRMLYSVTADGEARLRAALEAGPEVYGRQLMGSRYQSLHRAIFFAWVKGKPSEALAAIDSAEQEINWQAGRARSDADRHRHILGRINVQSVFVSDDTRAEYLAAAFRMIEAVAHSAELACQVNALPFLRKLVEELPAPPETFLQSQLSSEPGQGAEMGRKRNRKK